MFARMAREPGTADYDDYYARHPELKRSDPNSGKKATK
jgi:hypothetical protein